MENSSVDWDAVPEYITEDQLYVVSYTTHSWGGAALFADKVKQQGKTVINIANLLDI